MKHLPQIYGAILTAIQWHTEQREEARDRGIMTYREYKETPEHSNLHGIQKDIYQQAMRLALYHNKRIHDLEKLAEYVDQEFIKYMGF